jgi:type I site-specific restriction endonuclease
MNFPALNFPPFKFRIRETASRPEIFDPSRKKWVALTPEEWVRQHTLAWLADEKKYPLSIMGVEKSIRVNGQNRRCDIIVYGKEAKPFLIVECKAPEVEITQPVFDQAARYNLSLGADLFLLTNGLRHFCCMVEHSAQSYTFLKELPAYQKMNS